MWRETKQVPETKLDGTDVYQTVSAKWPPIIRQRTKRIKKGREDSTHPLSGVL